MMGMIKAYLNEKSIKINEIEIQPKLIAELITLIDENLISHITATQKIFPKMVKDPNSSSRLIAEKNNWIQEKDDKLLNIIVEKVINMHPEKAQDYKNGNKKIFRSIYRRNNRKLQKEKQIQKILSDLLEKN